MRAIIDIDDVSSGSRAIFSLRMLPFPLFVMMFAVIVTVRMPVFVLLLVLLVFLVMRRLGMHCD